MKLPVKLLYSLILSSVLISCSSSLFGNDDFVPDSDIEIIKDSATNILEIYSDSLFLHPFTILDLSRKDTLLNIDVQYAGGEGGCPSHLFVVNWDEKIQHNDGQSPLVKLGLAHFLPTDFNCEALVKERLEIDLNKVLGDQLQDDLSFVITNLVDSTQSTYNP